MHPFAGRYRQRGGFLALAGVYLTEITGNPLWDGIASMLIGVTLSGVALLLADESRSPLIGEAADPQVIESIRQAEDRGDREAGCSALRQPRTVGCSE